MIKFIKPFFFDFFNLFFPNNCHICDSGLLNGEDIICTDCLIKLPRTNYHLQIDNPISKMFYSMPEFKYATAYFFFHKGSVFQEALHQLKYKGMERVGEELGKLFGAEIVDSVFSEIDVIIPVPLHRLKYKKRGFNQSEIIAVGMSETMNRPLDIISVIRTVNTETQTKKNLEQRKENVSSIFHVKFPENLKNKHVLLIDDVVTTGSTLISLAEEILKIEGVKISVAALAVAGEY